MQIASKVIQRLKNAARSSAWTFVKYLGLGILVVGYLCQDYFCDFLKQGIGITGSLNHDALSCAVGMYLGIALKWGIVIAVLAGIVAFVWGLRKNT